MVDEDGNAKFIEKKMLVCREWLDHCHFSREGNSFKLNRFAQTPSYRKLHLQTIDYDRFKKFYIDI